MNITNFIYNTYLQLPIAHVQISSTKKRPLETDDTGPSQKKAKIEFELEEFFPNEVFLKIFKHLNVSGLACMGCTSKKFKELTEDNSLWDLTSLISLKDFPNLKPAPQEHKNLYKEFYLKQLILTNCDNNRSISLLNKYQIKPHSSLSNIYAGLHEALLGSRVDLLFKNLGLHQEEVVFIDDIDDEFFGSIYDAWDDFENQRPTDVLEKLMKPLNRLTIGAVQDLCDRYPITDTQFLQDVAELCNFQVSKKCIIGIAMKIKAFKEDKSYYFDIYDRSIPQFPVDDNLDFLKEGSNEDQMFYERLYTYVGFFMHIDATLECCELAKTEPLEKNIHGKDFAIFMVKKYIEAHKISF